MVRRNLKEKKLLVLRKIIKLLIVTVLSTFVLFIWPTLRNVLVNFVDIFLKKNNDILHALLILVTLSMGFIMNQFLSMLTNGSDRILTSFIIPGSPDYFLESLSIYKANIAEFLWCSVLLNINILFLFVPDIWVWLKISVLVLLVIEGFLVLRFYFLALQLFDYNLEEFRRELKIKNIKENNKIIFYFQCQLK